MNKCVDEGILQSYFDGELSVEMMEKVGSHLTSCLACKRAARELESESLLLSEALEPEFALSVPTERLRHRVNAAIGEIRLLNPPRPSLDQAGASVPVVRRWAQSVADLFALSPQRAFAYAGLAAVVLFAITFALVRLRSTQVQPMDSAKNQIAAPATTSSPENPSLVSTGFNSPQKVHPQKVSPQKVTSSQFVAANSKTTPPRVVSTNDSAPVKLLPGERTYLKTIAALDTSIKSDRDKPMRPALQSEYERNLAMVDRAIAATRNAAKSNPNDPDAAEFMFAAYQTKVDFLNQVADSRLSNRRQ
jgi:anti-sigma factor RsiW